MKDPRRNLLWWACISIGCLAVILRYALYSGFGAVDDVNDIHTTTLLLDRGPEPEYAHYYRAITSFSRAALFSAFGLSDFVFILPVFFFSTLSIFMALVLARDAFGLPVALATAVVVLLSPFDTLMATSNATDSINAFFILVTCYGVFRGTTNGNARWLILAGLASMAGMLNKISGIAAPLLVLLTTIVAPQSKWRWYWLPFIACFAAVCAVDLAYSGQPLRWISYNNYFDGFDVSSDLLHIWSQFPSMMLLPDEHGSWLFGLIGWLALFGVLRSSIRLVRSRGGAQDLLVVLAVLGLFAIVNFAPHRLSLAGYFSHIRIPRYLTILSPLLCLVAGRELIFFWQRLPRIPCYLSAALLIGFHGQQILRVTEPTRDAANEGRATLEVLEGIELAPGDTISTDVMKCSRIDAFYRPAQRGVALRCLGDEDRSHFLKTAPAGVVITGGATIPHYGDPSTLLNLKLLEFSPPEHWVRIATIPLPPAFWRHEPLEVWRVKPQHPDSIEQPHQ